MYTVEVDKSMLMSSFFCLYFQFFFYLDFIIILFLKFFFGFLFCFVWFLNGRYCTLTYVIIRFFISLFYFPKIKIKKKNISFSFVPLREPLCWSLLVSFVLLSSMYCIRFRTLGGRHDVLWPNQTDSDSFVKITR